MNEFITQMLFLPEQASTFAERIDNLHFFVISVTMIMSLMVGTAALLFFVRYRRRTDHQRTPVVIPSVQVEVAIVVTPLIFFLLWFAIGYRDFVWMQTPPKDAMDIYVEGKQWMWKFAYPEGPNSQGVLRVPSDRPVRLLMTSQDVIHSFYVPAFRVKQDVLPGRYTQIWFEATKPGRYPVYCTEYCGLNHSTMWAEVVVMPPAEYEAWMENQRRGLVAKQDVTPTAYENYSGVGNLIAQGHRVAEVKGCFKCHTSNGERHIGPSWLDFYGRQTTFTNGTSVIADEAYMTESMMDPMVRIVAGYQPVMPSYQGKLDEPETAALLEYIKSLRSSRISTQGTEGPVYEPIRGQ